MARRRKLTGAAVTDGGTLRARLRRREERDAERARSQRLLAQTIKGMGALERIRLCVFLDEDYFIVGMDALNLTLWRRSPKPGAGHRLLGYFPKLTHLLGVYLEHRVNTAASLKVQELIAVVERAEAAIRTLDGQEIVPVPEMG